LAEEEKGHVKITIDIELNTKVMEMMKQSMVNMPKMISKMREK
jgi:hypothetical protein